MLTLEKRWLITKITQLILDMSQEEAEELYLTEVEVNKQQKGA